MAITAIIDTTIAPSQLQAFSEPLQLMPQQTEETRNPFSAFFDAAMGMMHDTNRMQLETRQLQFDFATGRMDDILAVQMSMDRASNALQFTTQITNRIIESYREIMRMQI